MHRHVKVAHNSFVEGSHMAKNTASGNTFQTLLSRTGPGLAFINQTRLERLSVTNTLKLFDLFVGDGEKLFNKTATRWHGLMQVWRPQGMGRPHGRPQKIPS
jgi:hypothetical protein